MSDRMLPAGQSLNLEVTTPSLPEPVRRLIENNSGTLDADGDWSAWSRPTMVTPELKTRLPGAREVLERGLAPASREFIMAHLARLAAHYPSNAPAKGWEMRLADMAGDLGHLPPDIVIEAIRRYRTDGANEFFPKSGGLLKIANPLWEKRKTDRARIDFLLRLPASNYAVRTENTPEERAELSRKFKALREANEMKAAGAWEPVETLVDRVLNRSPAADVVEPVSAPEPQTGVGADDLDLSPS